MNVLFLSYDGLTDALGQSQIIPYITGLQKSGFYYTVISFDKKEKLLKLGDDINEQLHRENIKWISLPYTKKPPLFSSFKDVSVLRSVLKKFLKENKVDVIHCRSYVTMYAAQHIAKKNGVKIVFDMRGFWIDERVEGGLWNLSHPVYRWMYHHLKKT